MYEIILSFFAVIGVVLLIVRFLDFLFYRRFKTGGILILDLSGKTETEVIMLIELIATVRDRACGKAALEKTYLITDKSCQIKRDDLYRLLNSFGIPGCVHERENISEIDLNKSD